MPSKIKRITLKPKKRETVPGASPGTLNISPDAIKPLIKVYVYNREQYVETEVEKYAELKSLLNREPDKFIWVDIRGMGDLSLFTSIRSDFEISSLVFEDILNTHQRPKIEEYPEYCFAVSRMLCLNKELQLENEQISFILTKNILFTFQENYPDCLDPVRKRLVEGRGVIRTGGPSYMMYALMDVILDNYFVLINRFGEELDVLEERVYRGSDRSITYETQQIKKAFIMVRRAVWPERDKLNDMLRSHSELITDITKIYVRDAYDHSMQIIDLVEHYKEICNSLIDLYLSFTSNKMNEIVKVLTIISSIFIPLTFIAGVYGMNFAYQDPKTGKILKDNMPELYSEHGYVYTIWVMVIIAVIQLIWFWRKGWLR